jgi:bifunctional non-homologous end joining protein LigD
VSPPEPMLSSPSRGWPGGRDWVLQPKWDGFRLLVEIGQTSGPRAWSRHGTNLTDRLEPLLACFEDAPAGTIFDGELVAVGQRDGRPVPDFAAVTRAVLAADPAAGAQLRFVGFDVLKLDGEDVCGRRWRDRDALLAAALPVCERVRLVASQPATIAVHEAVVALGLEGSVLKRVASIYRSGRQRTWVKVKARHEVTAVVRAVRQDREGIWHAMCDSDGRRVAALAGPAAAELIGREATIIFSRVDADGGLREARLAPN